MGETMVTVSIDTEEDNWGSFSESGATVENIQHLTELQERLAKWGAKATYLVNYAPLLAAESVEVLGTLAERSDVEIGGHCHPWNTPPSTGEGRERSMMCDLPEAANRAKIAAVTDRIETELGVRPRSFRAGRWAFGLSVSRPLSEHGYLVDTSVSPFVDWAPSGGPDYSLASHRPYRFNPDEPFIAASDGSMVEIPTTVGFLKGDHRARARFRKSIERSPLRHVKVIGILERLGLLRRRWLSPETSSAEEMIRLAASHLRSGEPTLDITFHSCTLQPGLTPFIRDNRDRARFLDALDRLLQFLSGTGVVYRCLTEVGRAVVESDLTRTSREQDIAQP